MTTDNTQAEMREEILNEHLIHEIECSYSLYDEPCDCVQRDVATNIVQLITVDRERVALEARLDEHKRLSEITSMSINHKSAEITKASFMLNVNDWQKYRLDELTKELEK